VAIPGPGFEPAARFAAALNSLEFQKNFIKNFVSAFPEKKRLLFVHIPKCAGMDLEHDLGRRYPSLPQALTIPHITPTGSLHAKMRGLAAEIRSTDAIFVNGHIPLKWYMDHGVCRFDDRIFAVVREPAKIVLSWVNYILTVLVRDAALKRLDSVEWMAVLGERRIPAKMTAEELRALGRQILYNPTLVQPNYLCSYLGTGTATSCLDLLATSGVELIDISDYEEWRRERWGLEKSARINKSSAILTTDDLSLEDSAHIQTLTSEDRLFYNSLTGLHRTSLFPGSIP
jgi:hypothetical protein